MERARDQGAWAVPLGFSAGLKKRIYAPPESPVLVVGPTRSGKTRGILAPAVAEAPGAVVCVSTKKELLELTSGARRGKGRLWLYDPTGALTEVPAGVLPARYSPLQEIEDFQDALMCAHAISFAARPAASSAEGMHWIERAETLISCVLYASALGGRNMEFAVSQVLKRDLDFTERVLSSLPEAMPARLLKGLLETEERELSSIFSSAASLLNAFKSRAALSSCERPTFDPSSFVSSRDCLYVLSPLEHQSFGAPLVASLLESIRRRAYRKEGGPPVFFALDEAAHTARLPSFASMIAEGGGQGVLTLTCLQDLSQASHLGLSAESLFNLFPVKVLLPGTSDLAALKRFSNLVGERTMVMKSLSQTRRPFLPGLFRYRTVSRALSYGREPLLKPEQVFKARRGAAFVLDQYGRWGKIELKAEIKSPGPGLEMA